MTKVKINIFPGDQQIHTHHKQITNNKYIHIIACCQKLVKNITTFGDSLVRKVYEKSSHFTQYLSKLRNQAKQPLTKQALTSTDTEHLERRQQCSNTAL